MKISKFQSLNLAIRLHHDCRKLKMKNYLKDQLERASSSIALNLSEGNARQTTADRKKFFIIAYSSLKEVEVALLLSGVATAHQIDLADQLGGAIYRLIQNCR